MEKPAARGVGAAGSPDCSPQGVRRRRGSHRPVGERVEPVCETNNGPSGPSLQPRKIATRGTSHFSLTLPRLRWPSLGEAPSSRLSARLLRGRRTGGRDGRAGARALRRARSTSASRSSTTRTWSRTCESRGAVFVDALADVPEGATVVFSAHGIAPAVRREAEELRLTTIDATCPLVTKVHAQARRYAERRLRDRPHRARGARGGGGHARRGARRDRPRPVGGGRRARLASRRPAARVHHADDALGRRDERDRRRAAPPLPADRGAGARGHLLRDLEPAVGREGAARARSTCCSSSARRTRRTRSGSSTSRAPTGRRPISSTTSPGSTRAGSKAARRSASRRARRPRSASSRRCARGSRRAAPT